MRNMVIIMSGGTTTVINSTLAGIIQKAQEANYIDKIFAGYQGIIGLMHENLIDLTLIKNKNLNRLKITPASGFIGTARARPLSEYELQRIADVCEAYDIKYFLNIGGNGTIQQSIQLAEHLPKDIRVVALPKTVDNDLGDSNFKKVYYTPGYPSCANYWMHKIKMFNLENLGAFSHDKVLIAQTFGRKTGFLAACARLADIKREMPLMILLPEDQKPFDFVYNQIHNMLCKYGRLIIVLSEGYEIDKIGEKYDPSGQIMYGSSETTAAQILVNKCMDAGIQARHYIPGFDQRCDILYTLKSDLNRAFEIGKFAIKRLKYEETSYFTSIGINHISKRIKYITIPLKQIKNFSRQIPDSWIRKGAFDVDDAFIEYIYPLVHNQNSIGATIDYDRFLYPYYPNQNKKLALWNNNEPLTIPKISVEVT